MKDRKIIVLVDANAVMHRAYHAIPPLTTKKGELVNMVYGFASVLLKVIKDIKPDYIACAFDVAGGTFRDRIFAEYKAGRKKPDQEFYDQIDRVKEVLRAMNIPIYEKQGFEADDVIGTLSLEAVKKGSDLEVMIVTGDMDALQLVDDKVKVYAFKKGISETMIYDEKQVFERYGIDPKQVIDFKGIRGDASDNIPGIKGIGDKGAKVLLQEFGNLEKIYETIDKKGELKDINPRVLEKLISERKTALMSKELATIKRDMNIDFRLEDCIWGDYDKNELNRVFRELEFFSLISRLLETEKNVSVLSAETVVGQSSSQKNIKYFCVQGEKDLERLISEIQKSKKFVFRTLETEHLIACQNLTALIFIFENRDFFSVPISHRKENQTLFEKNQKENNFLEKLKPFLESTEFKKIGFDLKRDAECLAAYDIWLNGLEFDVMLSAYLLDPGKRDYGEDKVLFDNLEGMAICEFKDQKEDGGIDSKLAHLFNLFDLSLSLGKKMRELDMYDLFQKIEMPLISVLCKIEMNGVEIDKSLLNNASYEIEAKIQELSGRIHTLSQDDSFNINSSKQLAVVLFEKMKLSAKDIKKGKSGYSVAASELEKLRPQHEIIDFISKYRELAKLKNTYVDALPKLINLRTGRLHTTFNQIVTATGRLSSSDPNLQNIPVRTEEGRKIRKAFVAEKGRTMLSADYSQIELRIIATIADDKKMQEIFNKGLDIHSATAADVNQVDLKDVTYDMRRAAKALNFGIIYGMSVFGFAASAGIDRGKAKEFMDNYMKNFSAVATYLEKSKQDATEKGYAETLWGRRRYLPELQTSNAFLRGNAERMAINMPIQGTAADLMKINMIKIYDWVEEYNGTHPDAVRILLQVHDELLFSIQNEFVEEAEGIIKYIMENGHVKFDGKDINFSVPIRVDLKKGKNWDEMG
jgi:DNA polymerase-1